MSNEIKVGDKVRVREDAPKLIFGGCDMSQIVCTVCCVDKDIAAINVINDERSELKVWIVPTKYLVKVDAEKKEAKFKKGDKVKVNLPRSIRHNRIGTVVFAYASGNAVNVDFGDDDGLVYCDCGCLEPYTEPTEEKADIPASKSVGSLQKSDEESKNPNYWDAYAADLAKEVALKVANKFNDPQEAAEYAVSVAKAVVEGLKGK